LTGVLNLTVSLSPLVDAVTARLQNRLTATASSTLNYDDFYAGARLMLSQSFPTSDPNTVRYVNASMFSGYRLTSWLGASVSAQVNRQWFASVDDRNDRNAAYATSGLTWGVYGGFDAMLSVERF
jgi:hypothetical protein